jgi:type IV secretory pathway TrbF-like protein
MTSTPDFLPRPKSAADAQSEFEKMFGDPRRLNRYLATGLIAATALSLTMLVFCFQLLGQKKEKVVVRIDDVGRAEAIGFTNTYKVQPSEVRYFLTEFMRRYYSRNRKTIIEDFRRSLLFLDEPLATARMNAERNTKALDKFRVSGDDEVSVNVRNVVIENLDHEPYTAQVQLENAYVTQSGTESKREKFIVNVSFVVAKEVSNAAVPVNPLGLTITALSENQAF